MGRIREALARVGLRNSDPRTSADREAELIERSTGRAREVLEAGAMGNQLKAGAGAHGDMAAYFKQLSKAGLTAEPTLAAGDPKLAPIDGLSFEAYVKIAAAYVIGAAEGPVEAAGAELGEPKATTAAFEAWGDRVTSDAQVGLSYTAALQAEVAKLS